MTALGDATSMASTSGHMQLRALLEVLAPFALAVGVWIWSAMRRGTRRTSQRGWGSSRRSESQGIPMLYDMESSSQGSSDGK